MSASLIASWFLNHLWQSTVFAALAAGITFFFRSNSAAVRHNIWLIASLKFLLPFSVIITLGQRMDDWRPLPNRSPMTPIPMVSEQVSGTVAPAASVPSSSVFDAIRQPLSLAAPVASPASGLTFSGRGPLIIKLLVALWLLGVLYHLVSWLRQWLSIRARLHTATPLELDVPARIPVLSSSASIEPSVFGILRPVLLLPNRITTELSAAQIESILLHESAHVGRRDNLGAALHMIVECLFWFHPMVWWIGRRMAEERERACDERVLHRFDEPETYAEAILHVCKRHLKSPLACMAGVASSNLRERVEGIMNYRKPRRLNLGHKLMLTAAAVAATLGPLFVGLTEARQNPFSPVAAEAFAFSSIEVPGSTSTTARGINNLGQIVGSFVDGSGTHAFLFNNGKFSTIDVPGSRGAVATGINNSGQIVGGYGPGGETGNHGFLFSNGALSTVDFPGSLDTIAYGINNKGQIVGTYLGNDTYRHGFRLSGGNYTLIEVPGSRAGSARGISDAGQIAGLNGFSVSATGFTLTGETYTRLDSSLNAYLEPMGLNNLGDVVGQEGGINPPFHGFIRSASGASTLSLPGDPFAWNIQGINDLGQAVGEFTGRDGRTLGYLATPKALSTSGTGRPDQPPVRITDLTPNANTSPVATTPTPTPSSPSVSNSTEARIVERGDAPANGGRTLSGSLNVLINGLDNRIPGTNPANVERLQHLNNARALAVRDLESVNAARIATDNASRVTAPEQTHRFQLPDELQGVDPALIGTYNVLPVAANTLARSSSDPEVRARISGDLDTIGNEIVAALAASKAFNSGNGRGGRGGPVADGGETLVAALSFVSNRLDYVTNTTRPSKVERLQHLNNARALAGRALADEAAAAGSAVNRPAAPETTQRFQLPDDLQGVDPQLTGIYNSLNNAANALARSSGDREARARIAGDLDTIGKKILAALIASKE